MLKVIVGRCPEKKLESLKEKESLFLDDHWLYEVLNNNKKFEDRSYYYERIDLLVEKIAEISKEKDVLLHTLNPLILNWFENDVAVNSFYILDENGDLVKYFNDEHILSKLEVMGPGEIVAAHDFE